MELDELNSTHIIDSKAQTEKMLLNYNPIKLYNGLNEDYDSLRSMIMPSLLLALQQNKNTEDPENVFENGKICKWDKTGKQESGISEKTRVAAMICHRTANFTEIRQKFDRLMKLIDVPYEIKSTDNPAFIPGRVGRGIVKGKEIAYIGEMHPGVITNFGLDMPVATYELNLSEFFEIMRK